MADSITLATWLWLLIPAVICLGFSVWNYRQEQRRIQRKRRSRVLESRPHSQV